ncbi:MAG: hypothetical protein ACM3U2_01535, partial [Deltaproteobacteria bacterium]
RRSTNARFFRDSRLDLKMSRSVAGGLRRSDPATLCPPPFNGSNLGLAGQQVLWRRPLESDYNAREILFFSFTSDARWLIPCVADS